MTLACVPSTAGYCQGGGIQEHLTELQLHRMGISTVMIIGDSRMTAAEITAEAGINDLLAQATPENKLALISKERYKASWRRYEVRH